MTCPPEIRAAKDLVVLKRLIHQHEGIQKEASAWVEKNKADIQASGEAIRRLQAIMEKAATATQFLKTITEEERMALWIPENWEKYPELDYRNEMDGLYSNDPLKQYHEESGELLTGRKYRKYVA